MNKEQLKFKRVIKSRKNRVANIKTAKEQKVAESRKKDRELLKKYTK